MLGPNGKVKRRNGKEVHDWVAHDQSRKALMEAKEKAVRGDLQSVHSVARLLRGTHAKIQKAKGNGVTGHRCILHSSKSCSQRLDGEKGTVAR